MIFWHFKMNTQLKKLGSPQNENFRTEDKLKKSGNILPPVVQDYQSYPQSETKQIYQEEQPRNFNMISYNENANYSPSKLQSPYQPHRIENQAVLEQNPPKRMLLPAENMMFDERNSYKYSDFKNLENSPPCIIFFEFIDIIFIIYNICIQDNICII